MQRIAHLSLLSTTALLYVPIRQQWDMWRHIQSGGDVYHCQMDVAVIEGSGLLGASPFTMSPYVKLALLSSDGTSLLARDGGVCFVPIVIRQSHEVIRHSHDFWCVYCYQ